MKQANGFVSWLKALTSSFFRTVLLVGKSITKKTLIGCISGAGMHKSRATKFLTVFPNVYDRLVPRNFKWLLGSWKIWFELRQAVNWLDGGVFDSVANTSAEVNRVSSVTVARSVPHYCVKYWANSVRLATGMLHRWLTSLKLPSSLTWAPQLASWSSVTFAWQTNGFKHPLVSTSFFQPVELQTILKVPVIKVNEFITWNSLQLYIYIYW